jgi:soluble lytic murein transglycosylase
MPRLVLFLICFFFLASPATAADSNAAYYHRAFAAIDSRSPDVAETLAARGPDPVLNKVVRGYAMALPGNDYTFNQMNAFVSENPGWPDLRGIQMIAEQKIPSSIPGSQIVAWFSQHPPITLVGFYRFVDALNQSGQGENAQKTVRARWIENDFSSEEQTAFFARFGRVLADNDMWSRMDRLLWKNDQNQVRRLMPYQSAADRAVAGARLAFGNQDSSARSLLSHLPSSAQNAPGLLYQNLKAHVKNNDDDEANDILLDAPPTLNHAEAWWEQRHIMARRAIEKHDYALAYRLASGHGLTDPKPAVLAEFLSGWLALRFLNKPDAAILHFQNLYDIASTPVSRARGAYWLGRTYEVLGDKNEAEQAYEDAAVFNTTYYGQLATTRIYATPFLTAKSDPPIPDTFRTTFFGQDLIRAIESLAKVGEYDRARTFFLAATENALKRAEFILLTEVATQIHRPDLGIQAVKAANQKNMLVQHGGFPLVSLRMPTPPEPAFSHALIRQESMFNPDAASAAGARGLMQLMPRTAKDVCRKIGVPYSERRLDDPSYNLQLGTAFAAQQIERFDGSYVLALAGYNAGPARTREWVELFGDPRSGGVDPVDWIELIPISETRNYIQRIIESMQVYRSKLAGGRARLLIINDLKR